MLAFNRAAFPIDVSGRTIKGFAVDVGLTKKFPTLSLFIAGPESKTVVRHSQLKDNCRLQLHKSVEETEHEIFQQQNSLAGFTNY